MNASPYQMVFSSGTTSVGTAQFNPMTPAMAAHAVKRVQITLELCGESGNIKLVPGVQYSQDGLTWGTPAVLSGADDANADGYEYYPPANVPSGFSGPPTEDLFVRFGSFAYNTSSSAILATRARLILDVCPIASGSITAGPEVSPSSGSTSGDGMFTPLSGWVPSELLDEVWVSWEMDGRTSDVESVPGYQTSNDGVTLDAPVALSVTACSADQINYGTAWDSPASANTEWQAKRLARWGVFVRNKTGSTIGGCLSSIRVDWRRG